MIAERPAGQTLVARLFGGAAPREAMLIADRAAPGLEPTAPPSPADIPNNHLAYAVQWFLFASVAAIIYALALWRRDTARGRRP